MPDEDAPIEEGADDAALVEDVATDADPVEDAPAAEVYTREQLAELLGPRFERFASHEGEEAFRQFGSAYDSATGLIRQGAHLEPQDPSIYEQIGIDPSEITQPPAEEPDPGPGLWGVPWQVPTTWDEVQQYANSDDPSARRLAWIAVAQEPTAPEDVKQAYFSHWASIDPAGAATYQQQAMQAAFEERLAEHEARMQEQFGRTHEDLLTRNAQDLMETAKSQVDGFEDHASSVLALWNERVQQDAGYAERFLNAPRPDQIKELRRMTIIAAAEAAPHRAAAAAAAADQTDAEKVRGRTETSRTNGSPDTDAAALKRHSLEEAKRVFGQVR